MLIPGHDSILQRLLSVAGDTVYASAANVLARLAKGAANTKLFMNAGDTAPEWAKGLKVTNFTRLANAATASVSYASAGFKPSMVIVLLATDTSGFGWSVGVYDGTTQGCIYSYSTILSLGSSSSIAVINHPDNSHKQVGSFSGFDSDGGTIDWTLTGITAADTLNGTIIWFR
jgi:hypothetical protein